MIEHTQEAIQNLVRTLERRQRPKPSGLTVPTVTLSRSHGAGGREIARALAERLGVPLYDKAMLEAVAKEANVSREALERLDDQLGRRRMEWLYTLLSGENASIDLYRRHLFNVVLAVEQQGGVILGRGAHAILGTHRVFRVRIAGSERACVERLAKREGIEREEAERRVREVNRARDDFLQAIFNKPVEQLGYFDLMVNTDRYPDLDAVVELLLRAMAAQGYPVPNAGKPK